MKGRWLNYRRLTSFLAFASFLIMTVTGVVLYFTPHGRVAYWLFWEFLGLSKTDWNNIHIISSLAFAISVGVHLYFNWKAFTSYLTDKIAGSLKLKKEMIVASALGLFIIVGSIYLVPPLNYVIDFSEYLKNIWVEGGEFDPPIAHAEQLSLKVFAKKMGIDLEKASSELEAHGVRVVSVHDTLEKIARNNGTSPMQLYVLIKKFELKTEIELKDYTPELVEENFVSAGLGRKTLQWVFEDIGIDPAYAKKRLAENNIKINDGETLKHAAERYGIKPMDILKVILVEGYSIK